MKSTRRIGLLLALVFLLPALFFSVYEISSLNKDEEMIQEIYSKQLEAILFSINQYSDDVLNGWISKIETGLTDVSGDSIPHRIKELLAYNSSLNYIFVSDTNENISSRRILSLDSIDEDFRKSIGEALTKNRGQIRQLITYKKSGFQKVGLLLNKWGDARNLQCLIFITDNPSPGFQVVGLFINPDSFIQDFVGPRLQVIANDQFILSAFNIGLKFPIYSTMASDSTTAKAEALTKSFWLFPEYALGIRTKGSSIQVLVKERTTNNLILLLSLDVILIIAVILVFQNVKKEVQLAQNKADFVSNVSHEIRTPLALISMFAETLEMGRVKSEEKKQEYYGIISKETHRLSGIVNKILNFSQTEANKKIFYSTHLNLGAELKGILKTYDFHLTNKGFEYTLTENVNVEVVADKEALTEIIVNLIDNAMKYSADKKKIEITIGAEDGYGYVIVKDYGVGISTADQKHIFDKFYRVSTGDLAKSTGTGLGLSLVKQLVSAQNGKINVVSLPGVGSSFTVYFPVKN
jgi:two-component system, OmpR family, phosphate regulon sensor histidine kinase PhoR